MAVMTAKAEKVKAGDLSEMEATLTAQAMTLDNNGNLGIGTASDEYLAGYVRKCPFTPSISLDRVMKSVWLLEQMGRTRLGLRKAAMSQMVVPLLISDRAMRAQAPCE